MHRPLRRSTAQSATLDRAHLRYAVISLFLVSCTSCISLPNDPEKTLQHVEQQHTLRVGVVENPPWVVRTGSEPGGVEVQLVREFAATLGAKPQWYWGAEQQEMEALEHFHLDIIAGGLGVKTPWSSKIALTIPYFAEPFLVGVPPGMAVPRTLKGVKVATRADDVSAVYLAELGATPAPVQDIDKVSGPIAGPEWRVRQLGLVITPFHLWQRKHVMACPPGENGWLKRVDEFLQQNQSRVQSLLESSAAEE